VRFDASLMLYPVAMVMRLLLLLLLSRIRCCASRRMLTGAAPLVLFRDQTKHVRATGIESFEGTTTVTGDPGKRW
jgi:hypothetical protein